jgi:hypothetical protein
VLLGAGVITPTEVVPWAPVTPAEMGPGVVGGNIEALLYTQAQVESVNGDDVLTALCLAVPS